ncbi:hypothetical protein ACFUJR_27835 [Streptomyces sp. NPDC057271]|uniref:hypothetical protein n=1 Tax=Streptomyces sp. NPDC057271 TaxID=3346078 RepID=UPI00362F732E
MTQPRPAEHCGHQPDPVIGRPTECVLRPGHSGSHADHTGMRWWLATQPAPQEPTAAEAALATLHQGEEPHTDECTVPTPGQWIWSWNRATPHQRLEAAAQFLHNATAAEACFFGAHTHQIERLQQRVTDTEALHTQATADFGRVVDRLDAARAVAHEWHAYFGEQGDAPAAHALALVLSALATGETP